MDANNIFHGTAASVSIDGTDMGVPGENSVEITFTPNATALGDGQQIQTHGTGQITIELAETDSTHLAVLEAARETPAVVVVTALDGKTYTITSLLLQHEISRPFSEGVHTVTVTGTKFVINESDFVTIA